MKIIIIVGIVRPDMIKMFQCFECEEYFQEYKVISNHISLVHAQAC